MNRTEEQIKHLTAIDGKPPVIGGFSIVPEDKEFKFIKLCPYCQGDLTYTANGWEQDDNGLWMADSFDVDCSTEPDMENEDEWNDWMNRHSEMPYVHQLQVDERVKKFINSKYRFEVNCSTNGLWCIRVQANNNCWIADWDGDPGRTLVRENARTFTNKSDAERLCRKMKSKYPNRNLWVDVFYPFI